MWRLGIQISLPENYWLDPTFPDVLKLLKTNGIDHLELNVQYPDREDPDRLMTFMHTHGLTITKIATGATAKREGLSLSSPDARIRKRTVQRCLDFVAFAEVIGADLIFGSIKGMESISKETANGFLLDALNDMAGQIFDSNVRIYIEAINRYENTTVNSITEGVACIRALRAPAHFRLLPDTYHMNIEEANYFASLHRNAGYIDTIHISDSNRLCPGLGSYDFITFFKFLAAIDYQGTLTIEAITRGDLKKDFMTSIRYLNGVLSHVLLEEVEAPSVFIP